MICLAGYQTDAQKDAEAAAYEKRYSVYRETPQPKITNINLVLELFPKTRKAHYTAGLVLENRTSQAMDTLHVDWDKKLLVEKFVAKGHALEKMHDDAPLRHFIYRVRPALMAGESMSLDVEASLAYKGFHQSDFQGDLTYDGTVLGADFLPFFGYDRSRELTNNKERLRQGLAVLRSRQDSSDNAFSRANRFESLQSDGLMWNMVVGTDADQQVVGPGKRVRSWRDNGRNYARFTSQFPGGADFRIISADLASREFDCQGMTCQLLHSPCHTYNLDVFQAAMEKAIPWLSQKLGPFPHDHVQVAEKPFYDSDFISYANVTAISERRGWTADIQKDEDAEYIYLIIAEQLARQRILADLNVADVQGAQLLTESIARYYAFRFMDELWGHEQTSKWLDAAFRDYEKGKAEEGIAEKPLLLVDRASYLSRHKGGLALYALAQRIGVEPFDHWLAGWMVQAAQKEDFLTSNDLFDSLKPFAPAGLHPFANDWLARCVQYRLSLAKVRVMDGKLSLTIQAAKQEHDGNGRIDEVPFAIPLEVGLTDESGQVQTTRQVVLKPGEHTYDVDCTFVPASVILDPNYWYLVANRKACSSKI